MKLFTILSIVLISSCSSFYPSSEKTLRSEIREAFEVVRSNEDNQLPQFSKYKLHRCEGLCQSSNINYYIGWEEDGCIGTINISRNCVRESYIYEFGSVGATIC